MSKSKQIGTTAETYLVRYLKSEGFDDADRVALSGALDRGDVRTAGVCYEVKAGQAAKTAADGLVSDWLGETEAERRNAGADLGVLVLARAGYGEKRVGQWWAVVPMWGFLKALGNHHDESDRLPVRVHLGTLVALLRAAGYGPRRERQVVIDVTREVVKRNEGALTALVAGRSAGVSVEPRAKQALPKLRRGARFL